MKFTEIQISGLREGTHSFQFLLDSRFSDAFQADFFSKPSLKTDVRLDTSETMLKAEIQITGSVELECDRSLEKFRMDVSEKLVHFYKFGEEEQELSDEIDVISPERVHLDFDQLIYDTVALSLPQKKVHPDLRSEEDADDASEGRLIYSSAAVTEEDNEKRDTRWDILKNLN
jgi:uncharacterized protein